MTTNSGDYWLYQIDSDGVDAFKIGPFSEPFMAYLFAAQSLVDKEEYTYSVREETPDETAKIHD